MAHLIKASLHITGIVQGVGFRPFIYSLAQRYSLKGWVRNTSAGVDIEVDGTRPQLEAFAAAIRAELPPLARIDSLDLAYSEAGNFNTFEIISSAALEGAFQPISPDVCICPDCLRELFDPADRRYHYPFINCTNCGPRFTIITDIPYDRPNTTMAGFPMCPECRAEYEDPLDRRFHAQPVACPVCGPRVWLEWEEQRFEGDGAFRQAQNLLAGGRILAVKGLGGFHLACDAANENAVEELRRRKLRVDKPFALMMPDLAAIESQCYVSPAERELLESRQRPIVLLRRKPDSRIAALVAPRQETLGVMLPYTPLHYLLLDPMGQAPNALVMTSGNLSEEPIATGNDEARQRLSSLADAFMMHDREIRTRCDDSVVRTTAEPAPYFLRRSRGYAPDPIRLPLDVPPLLAVGPELKNTFCLTRDKYAFLSPHIGDMENYETLRSFEDGTAHMERLFRIQPQALVRDLHPDYLSTRYALERSVREDLPVIAVQHHHAHIASCMADNGLDGSAPVIGLSFDGTGYGTDGAIWGGEVLVADYAGFERRFHLAYFPLPGGEAAIRHPARTALGLLWSLGLTWDEDLAPVCDLCSDERLAVRLQLERRLNTPQTSSMGRLFDAAAALAGVCQQVNYEAQAAVEFEAALDPAETGAYLFELSQDRIELYHAISALLADVRLGTPLPVISARFHNGLAALSRSLCMRLRQETGISVVALSGGVWQNMSLLERVVPLLRTEGFTVLVHRQVPANDGGLSLGQALVGAKQLTTGALP